MIKTLQNALKQDREGFDLPRSVQDAIPIRRLWPDGIFQFGSKFSNNNNFSAVVPYDLEQQRKETREMLDDLTTRDQRMMFAVVTLVHLADSKEELDSDTDALQSAARKHLCQLATLNWQQADGLVTALPLGLRRIDALRTLTTEALAVLMPFKAQEVRDQGGVYYGQREFALGLIKQALNEAESSLDGEASVARCPASEEPDDAQPQEEDDPAALSA